MVQNKPGGQEYELDREGLSIDASCPHSWQSKRALLAHHGVKRAGNELLILIQNKLNPLDILSPGN